MPYLCLHYASRLNSGVSIHVKESWPLKYQAYALAASPVIGLILSGAREYGRYAYFDVPFAFVEISKIDFVNSVTVGIALWLYVAFWAIFLAIPSKTKLLTKALHLIANAFFVSAFVGGPHAAAQTKLGLVYWVALVASATFVSMLASVLMNEPAEAKEQKTPKHARAIGTLNVAVFLTLFACGFSFVSGYFNELSAQERTTTRKFPNHVVVSVSSTRLVLKPINPIDHVVLPGAVRVITPPPSDIEYSQSKLKLVKK